MSKIIDNSRDRLVLTRPHQLRALADDRRRRILLRLNDGPRSITRLAEELGLARGTAGYHVKLLEDAGLIHVAATRQRRGFVEKLYEKTARLYVIEPQGLDTNDLSAVAATGLREAAAEVRVDEDRASSAYGLVHARLRPARAAELAARLLELLAEFGGDDADGDEFGLVGAMWRRHV